MAIWSSCLIVLSRSSISLLSFCLLVLSITERGVEVFNYNCGFVCCSFQIYRFLTVLFDCLGSLPHFFGKLYSFLNEAEGDKTHDKKNLFLN